MRVRVRVTMRVRVRVYRNLGGEELLDQLLDPVLQPQHKVAQGVEGGE